MIRQVRNGIVVLLMLPLAAGAQDTLQRPGIFEEGYFFIGPGDVLKFKSYVQMDAYAPFQNSPGNSEFIIRRARFAFTGFFRQHFRYMLYVRYDRGRVSLNEAFLEARHLPYARLRIGQFKVPFSLSNLQSSSQLDFVNRAFVIENFSPNYDIGAMLFGNNRSKHVDYALGIFNGTGPNKRDNNSSKTVIGRLVIAPFASLKNSVYEKMYVGGSFAHGKQRDDFSRAGYKLFTETPIFSYGDSTRHNGQATVYGYDLEWLVKNFSLTGEYLHYKAEDLRQNSVNTNLSARGYYVAATFLLTGEEKKRNEIVKPRKQLNPAQGGWGAFELAARYEKTDISNGALETGIAKGSNGLHGVTYGLNWYPNDDVKLVLNYQRYSFNQPVMETGQAYQEGNFILLRVQYQF